MAKRTTDDLRVRDRVTAAQDLPGIREGTEGRVILVNGLEWTRYRVHFDVGESGGTDVGFLNRDQLVLVNRKGEPIAVGSES